MLRASSRSISWELCCADSSASKICVVVITAFRKETLHREGGSAAMAVYQRSAPRGSFVRRAVFYFYTPAPSPSCHTPAYGTDSVYARSGRTARIRCAALWRLSVLFQTHACFRRRHCSHPGHQPHRRPRRSLTDRASRTRLHRHQRQLRHPRRTHLFKLPGHEQKRARWLHLHGLLFRRELYRRRPPCPRSFRLANPLSQSRHRPGHANRRSSLSSIPEKYTAAPNHFQCKSLQKHTQAWRYSNRAKQGDIFKALRYQKDHQLTSAVCCPIGHLGGKLSYLSPTAALPSYGSSVW